MTGGQPQDARYPSRRALRERAEARKVVAIWMVVALILLWISVEPARTEVRIASVGAAGVLAQR